jgi:hypothetical protein
MPGMPAGMPGMPAGMGGMGMPGGAGGAAGMNMNPQMQNAMADMMANPEALSSMLQVRLFVMELR